MYNNSTVHEYFDPQDISANRVVAGVSYFYFLFFLPLVICPHSRYARFHANQALLLFIVSSIGGGVLRMIPFLGGFAAWIFGICITLFGIFGFLNAYTGKVRELPYVGHLRIIK